jgi:hypothetical protein
VLQLNADSVEQREMWLEALQREQKGKKVKTHTQRIAQAHAHKLKHAQRKHNASTHYNDTLQFLPFHDYVELGDGADSKGSRVLQHFNSPLKAPPAAACCLCLVAITHLATFVNRIVVGRKVPASV